MTAATFLQIDFAALLAATLAAQACALVGNLLVLTRQAMLSDALSHVMLPGVLTAFLLTGSAAAVPMLLGGVGAALVAAGLIALLVRAGGVDPSAAIGVVFTALFAAGVVGLERSGAAHTTFDVHHVLYGNLEGLVWPTATGWGSLVDPARLAELPPELGRMALVLGLVCVLMIAFGRPLALAAFDADFAAAIGLPTRLLSLLLLVMTALASVAAFEAVGVILALAMIVCPAAAARQLTDRLDRQIGLSLAVAGLSVVLGYAGATLGPTALGYDLALNAGGSIGVVSGLLLAIAIGLDGLRRRFALRTPA